MGALDDAISILGCFSFEEPTFTQADIARQIDRPKATVHRALKSLRESGLVDYEPNSRVYSPGLRLYELGQVFRSQNQFLDLIVKQLQQVCDRVGYTGYITVFDGYDLTILQVIRGKNPLAITRIPAYKTIAYSTSNGRAMLSMLSEEEWKKRIPDPMPYISPRTPSNHEELSQALEKIRQTGRSFATEESLAGIASVGIAIRDPDTTEIFGAAISFPANLVTEQERETIAELMDKMKSNLAGIKGIFE